MGARARHVSTYMCHCFSFRADVRLFYFSFISAALTKTGMLSSYRLYNYCICSGLFSFPRCKVPKAALTSGHRVELVWSLHLQKQSLPVP